MRVISDKNNWNQEVQSFLHWDVAHEWGYFAAFQHRDETFQPLLFVYESKEGRIAYPLNKRKLSAYSPELSENKYYLSAVYGYTGALIDANEDIEKLWEEFSAAFRKYCQENQILRIEENFHPLLENQLPLFEETKTTKARDVIIIKTAPEDVLEQSYCRKDKRRGVKTAKKKGVVIRREGIEQLDRFLEMYYQTMDHNQAPEIYYFEPAFFQTLFEEFNERFVMFNAYLDDQIIESILYLYTPLCAFSFLSARDVSYAKYHANDLISQKAYAYFHEIGVERVNEGGGRTADPEDSLFLFKRGFTKKSEEVQEIFPYHKASTEFLEQK
ncbi:peptidoglycan bridge formation glycyltransferase FemA/FemB family protein [Enterococcus sp. AZ109]|uniref:peptidoglycan bridge formation glycyltransferase FemA/FemB family protein n=1 Tax=Enterococcus sp. AZ109 TaxID=2774634 RepID=UPI003F27F9BA